MCNYLNIVFDDFMLRSFNTNTTYNFDKIDPDRANPEVEDYELDKRFGEGFSKYKQLKDVSEGVD